MAGSMRIDGARRANPMRIAVWGTAAFLWLLPLVAMQFTAEVDWDALDFAIIGVMLLAACATYELSVRLSDSPAYRAGFGMAVVAAFLLVWVNLAVGMIGDEGNPANLLFAGVLGVGIVGAAIARFRPAGMARTLAAMALTQVAIAGFALVAGWDDRGAILSGLFALLWFAAAALFRVGANATLPARAQKLADAGGRCDLARTGVARPPRLSATGETRTGHSKPSTSSGATMCMRTRSASTSTRTSRSLYSGGSTTSRKRPLTLAPTSRSKLDPSAGT